MSAAIPSSNPTRASTQQPLRCIWMEAGLLTCWLCDRQLDCDACPLDRFLSGRRLEAGGGHPPGEDELHFPEAGPLEPLRIPFRRRGGLQYHGSHVWVLGLPEGRVRLGLDDLAARLLNEAEGWVFPPVGARLGEGDPLGRTRVQGTAVRVPSPLAGQVLRRNENLRTHPALVTWSPYDAGWICELVTPQGQEPWAGFRHAPDEVSRWFDEEIGRLAACASLQAPEALARLGVTHPDGGVPVSNLTELLGPEGHRRALREFFSPPPGA